MTPERDTPGSKAKDWANPIRNALFTVNSVIENDSLLLIFSENIKSIESRRYEIPVTKRIWGLSSMVFWIGVKKPTKAAGITPTTTTFRKNKKVG